MTLRMSKFFKRIAVILICAVFIAAFEKYIYARGSQENTVPLDDQERNEILKNITDVETVFPITNDTTDVKATRLHEGNKNLSENGSSICMFMESSNKVQVSRQNISHSVDDVRHVAFLKVHKTGSSTVQNLFIRFGDSRNLTFVMGNPQRRECRTSKPHCISFHRSLHKNNILPAPENRSYDILCSHVIYNRIQFTNFLQSDTVYIGLVREPASRLASAISFFHPTILNGVTLAQYADDPTKYNHIMLNNRMAYEFGFRKEWFPNTTHYFLSDVEMSEVQEYVDELFNEFDLIMVNEMLDASLVLLRRRLKWHVTDIIYHTTLVRKHPKFNIKDIPKLKHYLYLDYILYQRAIKAIEVKIAGAGNDFIQEVNTFASVNQNVNRFCACSTCRDRNLVLNETACYGKVVVSRSFCDDLLRKEIPYFLKVMRKQYGTQNVL